MHLAGIHWMFRTGVGIGVAPKLLVQRPLHISRFLDRKFDDPAPPPQECFFLRRNLTRREAAVRVLRARDALKSGNAVYMAGDVPLETPNSRPGRLMGRELPFLSVWAELAVLSQAHVSRVFCLHEPGGCFKLVFEEPRRIDRGEETAAQAEYFDKLEKRIQERPTEAIAYLLWECYQRRGLEELDVDCPHIKTTSQRVNEALLRNRLGACSQGSKSEFANS